MHWCIFAVLLAPTLAAALALCTGWTPVARVGLVAAAAAQAAAATALAVVVGWQGRRPESILGGSVRVDALSAFMLLVIALVGLLAAVSSGAYLADEMGDGRGSARGRRFYGALVPLFLAVMSLAVMANNVGIIWVCVEATTIVTAFLVGHARNKLSLEAAWKYVVIGSTGVALALLGTVLVYFAAVHAGTPSLRWTQLVTASGSLDPGVMRIAFGLLLLGFGTKAGLAPMHSWLPDAHSQAPSPVSALMSGVLTSVALYALLRYLPICLPAVGESLIRGMFAAAALLSLAVAASLLIAQRDFKRMLAYSTVENMGLMALGVAAGTQFAIAAVLLHMLGHGLTKSALFVTAGRIQQEMRTTRIGAVTGLLASRPNLDALWAVGLVALVGFPPFSIFFSELGILGGALAAGMLVVTLIALGLLLVAYAAVARHGLAMVLGSGTESASARHMSWSDVPAWVALAACALIGICIGAMIPLLTHAAAVVTAAN